MILDESPQALLATAESMDNTLKQVMSVLDTIDSLCQDSRQTMRDQPSEELFASLCKLTDQLKALVPGYQKYIEKLQARGEAGVQYLNGGY